MKTDLRLTDTNAASDSKGRTWGLEGGLFWWLVGGVGVAITVFFVLVVLLHRRSGIFRRRPRAVAPCLASAPLQGTARIRRHLHVPPADSVRRTARDSALPRILFFPSAPSRRTVQTIHLYRKSTCGNAIWALTSSNISECQSDCHDPKVEPAGFISFSLHMTLLAGVGMLDDIASRSCLDKRDWPDKNHRSSGIFVPSGEMMFCGELTKHDPFMQESTMNPAEANNREAKRQALLATAQGCRSRVTRKLGPGLR
jgi:hypothetical protein